MLRCRLRMTLAYRSRSATSSRISVFSNSLSLFLKWSFLVVLPRMSLLNIHGEQKADIPESLHLKSAETPIASDGSKLSSSNAVLCTDDHTFQLRQVQSSNSMFILQPSKSGYQDNELAPPSLSAIAQCTSTLELIPSDTAVSRAMIYRLLQKNLPIYKGIDTDTELGIDIASGSKRDPVGDQAV